MDALRSVAATVLGVFVGVVVIMLVEASSSLVFPLPSGLDPTDTEAMRGYMPRAPLGGLILVLAGWAAAAGSGAWVAARFGGARGGLGGLTVGGVLLLAAVANMLMLPHPIWFWIVALLVFPLATLLGCGLARRQVLLRRDPLADA